MEKRYTALVKGKWSKKRHSIDAPLYQNSRCTVVDAKGKEALSHFQPTPADAPHIVRAHGFDAYAPFQ
jgi:23S rRNA-/tRNA-specific pseudouridylate synthase